MKWRPYPEYKPSGIEWLGEVPEHWEVRRLKDHGRLVGGAGFPHEEQGVEGEELSFYKVGDLRASSDGCVMGISPHTISRETAKKLRASIISPGSIVYAKIGAALLLNRRRITSSPCCIDNNMTAYVADKRFIVSKWAYYCLSILDFGEFVNPGAVPSYSEGDQGILPIQIPPLSEQTTIAAFLDRETARIDTLIEKKQRQIELLQEKRSALISHAVTKGLDLNVKMKDSGIEWLGEIPQHWTVDRFKRSVKSCRNGTWGSEALGDENDIKCIRVADFDRKRLTTCDNILTIRNVTGGERFGRTLAQGNLLLEKSGGGNLQSVGFVVLYNSAETAICSNFVAKVQLAEGMNPSYWRYCHASAYSVRLNYRSIKQTTGIQNLDQSQYLDERAPFPPSSEQRAIAAFLDRETARIDLLIEKVEKSINLLREYRTALISAAVTGKIDVREVVA